MTDEYRPGYLENQSHRLILGQIGDAAELAATAIWLASPAAVRDRATIVVNGGLTISCGCFTPAAPAIRSRDR